MRSWGDASVVSAASRPRARHPVSAFGFQISGWGCREANSAEEGNKGPKEEDHEHSAAASRVWGEWIGEAARLGGHRRTRLVESLRRNSALTGTFTPRFVRDGARLSVQHAKTGNRGDPPRWGPAGVPGCAYQPSEDRREPPGHLLLEPDSVSRCVSDGSHMSVYGTPHHTR